MDNNDSGFVDISLNRPLEIDGAKVSTLRLREPTVGDQIAMDEYKGGDAAKELFVLSNLTQIAPADLKKLTLKDYKKLQEAFLGFIS